MTGSRHDCDWLVIGSGFGGSVSALRLAEKGYRVKILECGRRFADEDFAKTTWEAARYYWMPKLGLKGIFRLTLFKDVFVASGIWVTAAVAVRRIGAALAFRPVGTRVSKSRRPLSNNAQAVDNTIRSRSRHPDQ